MAKNRTMAQKNAKAKKEANKARLYADYGEMTLNKRADSTAWNIDYKPFSATGGICFNTKLINSAHA